MADLTPAQKREIAWGRRAFVRDVGRIYMDLIEAGEPPGEYVDDTKRDGRRRVEEAKKKAA